MSGTVFANPLGAMGGDPNWAVSEFETKASATIVANTVVAWNTDGSGSVLTAPATAAGNAMIAGVALNNAAAGEIVHVCRAGLIWVVADAGVVAADATHGAVSGSLSAAGNIANYTALPGTAGTKTLMGKCVLARQTTGTHTGQALCDINIATVASTSV